MKIIVPKEESDTGRFKRDRKDRWGALELPESDSELEEFDWLTYLGALGRRVKEMDDKLISLGEETEEIGELKKDIEKQKSRIPEIVGLFSAIIALVLIDVSIIKSAERFLPAILLIAALTCSIVIFAWLIHLFFSPEDRPKFKAYFFIAISFLLAFIIIGIIFHVFDVDIYSEKGDKNSLIESQQGDIIDSARIKPVLPRLPVSD